MSSTIVRFGVVPLLAAIIMYLLAHVHLLVIDKLINIPVHRQVRTRISLWAFFVTFILVLGTAIVREVFQ